MQVVSGFFIGLVGFALTVVMLLLLAATARRVMGASVGWIRSAVVAFAMLSVASWVLTNGLLDAGWSRADGTLTVAPGVALVAVVLAFAWAFVLGLCVLLVLELLVPTGSVPGPWRALRGLRQGRRETRRYAQILAIGVRHGLGGALTRGARQPDGSRLSRTDQRRQAAALRNALSDAGVTFVKFGQVLSTRRDLLPGAFADALSTLQSEVPPAPWSQVEAAVDAALGRPVDEAFAEFSPEPLASASVGQVHAARLLDGRDVVVKVQRPGARAQVETDLAILGRLARRIERDTAWGRSLGVVDLADGFAASLREELDYTVELENTLALRAALARGAEGDRPLHGEGGAALGAGPRVRVPEVYPELSGTTLLVMERLDGVPVGRAGDVLAGLDGAVRADLASRLLTATLEQVLVAGTFHADLHPGNVLVTDDGRLGLLDMGSVGRLGEPERLALAAVLLAVDADDAVAATDALLELLDAPADLDVRRLERAVGQVIVRFRGAGASGAMFTALFRLVTDAGLAVPSQVAAAFRTFTSLEGTLRLIDPGFDLVAGARATAQPLVRRVATPEGLRERATSLFLGLAPELERLPRRLAKITSDVEAGRLTVNVRSFAHPEDRAFLTGLVQQVVSTVIAAAAVVAAVVLVSADSGPELAEGLRLFAVLGAALGFVGTVLAVRVLVFAFRGTAVRRE
ncbi:AarF/ABC1/UbiB kinase family protein [Cellulosimicrobium cellulans]|uniref:ABC1 kinase family protein n=1 Tax=Cellulosimicrobium cellulans TaxID=1710 RepID=UPI00196373F3|nr:AarF/UbiB family protein [Cellulosimicrobium cellulans]MBN0039502.1 AarF/ABC1/UbiB kinase family protein [Cellulosimicrobium cellulans]